MKGRRFSRDNSERRKEPRKWTRVLLVTCGAVVSLVLILGASVLLLLKSDSFRRYALARAERQASEALGAPVRVQTYHLQFSGLSPTLDLYGISVEGAQPHPTPALLQVEHVRIGIRIVSLLERKWYLSNLEVHRPVLRVFVDEQGRSNLPQPTTSGSSSTNIFALAIHRATLNGGEAYFNSRRTSLFADLRDLDFGSSFNASKKSYSGSVRYRDGRFQIGAFAPLAHDMQSRFEASPQQLLVQQATLRCGESRVFFDGTLVDYSHPKINARYNAAIEAEELRHVVKSSTLPRGVVMVTGSLQYSSQPGLPLMQALTSSGTLSSQILQVPKLRTELRDVRAQYFLNGGRLDLRDIRARALGGELIATLTVEDLAGQAVSQLHASMRGVSIDAARKMTNMAVPAQVGISGSFTADAEATWKGALTQLRATADSTLQATLASPNSSIPVSGDLHALYAGDSKQLTIRNSHLATPQTSLNLDGTVSNNSALQVQIASSDLNELGTLVGLLRHSGTLPSGLKGTASFTGSISGTVNDPRVHGQFSASNFQIRGTAWRQLTTAVDASPSLISLQRGDIQSAARGRATFSLRAELQQWAIAPDSAIQLDMNVSQLDVADLRKLAERPAPVSGELYGHVQLRGTELNPIGSGTAILRDAIIAGEPVSSATVRFRGTGDSVRADIDAHSPAGAGTASITYQPKSQAYEGEVQARGIRLEQLQLVRSRRLPVSGVMNLTATGRGTISDPQLSAGLQLPTLRVQNETINGITLQADVANHVAQLALDSSALQSRISGRGTIMLTGDYPANITLDTQTIPLPPLLASYVPDYATDVVGQTEVHATLRGPLKNRSQLAAHITMPILTLKYKDAVELTAPAPITINYANGVLNVERSALRGTGTDLQFQGRIPVADRGAPISLLLLGTVDLRLLHLLYPDLNSSGQLRLNIDSFGQRAHPDVHGQIEVVNASLSTSDSQLALQNGNGLLTLTRDRLDITRFQGGMSGGSVTARGTIALRPAIQFDVTMSGQGIRVFYPEGTRSRIAANVAFTGTTEQAVLSGQVDVDQLSLTPEFDLTKFLRMFNQAGFAPPPQGFMNNIQLQLGLRSSGINLVSRQLSIQGAANMSLRGSAAQPVLLGRVNLNSGDLIFNGNRFKIQNGALYFSNPTQTEANVNLALTTTVKQYNITVRLDGPIDRLRTNYTSDPALPPADIINLVAFRSTTEAAGAAATAPGNLGAQSVIASAVGNEVTSRIERVAGISQISIDPTLSGNNRNPSATVTLQQRVTGKIFVTFSTDVTSTGQQIIQLEYEASPRLSFTGTREQNGGFAFETRIRRRW